jgi:homotetrameric cytidine deaminase
MKNWTELLQQSYSPYSGTTRACLIEGDKGGVYAGVRVENVSFPLTISAIQAACLICLSEGERPTQLYIPDSDFSQLEYWKSEFELTVNIGPEAPFDSIQSLGKTTISDELGTLKKLLDEAVTINSDFPVSAVLYTSTEIFEGVNVEVSDWQMGLCAERVALCKAIAAGAHDFTELAVHTRDGEVSSPCGACRQVIIEHLPLNKLRLYHLDETKTEHFSSDLLPFNFTSKSLRS